MYTVSGAHSIRLLRLHLPIGTGGGHLELIKTLYYKKIGAIRGVAEIVRNGGILSAGITFGARRSTG